MPTLRLIALFLTTITAALLPRAQADSIEWQLIGTDPKTAAAIGNATFNGKLTTPEFEDRINKLITAGKVKKHLTFKKDKPTGTPDEHLITSAGTPDAWEAHSDSSWPSKNSNYVQHLDITTPKGFLTAGRSLLTVAQCPTLIPNRWVIAASWLAKGQSTILLQKLVTTTPDLPEYHDFRQQGTPGLTEFITQKTTRTRLDPQRVKQAELDRLATDLTTQSPDSIGVSINHAANSLMGGSISELENSTSEGWIFDCQPNESVDTSWIDYEANVEKTTLYGLAPVAQWCLLHQTAPSDTQTPVTLVKFTPLVLTGDKPPVRDPAHGMKNSHVLAVHPGLLRLLDPAKPHRRFIDTLTQAGCQVTGKGLMPIGGSIVIFPQSTSADEAATLEKFLRERLLMWDQFPDWKAKNPTEFATPK
ncbi:hypothetical protein [Luteolibacter soli]|uniref:Uncharacterized protein n=1 Tax=Luteolibacter soli TaxID=3135280 RepID=A0ABU9AV61_9BACT